MNEAGITNSMRTDHGGGHSRIMVVQLVQVLPHVLNLAPDVFDVGVESTHQVSVFGMASAGTTRASTPGTRLVQRGINCRRNLHTRRRHLIVLEASSTPPVLLPALWHHAPAILDRADALD